jgi:hypothetical protein
MGAAASLEGTVTAPIFHEGRADSQGDVKLRSQYMTYRTSEGVVAGVQLNVMFTLDRPAEVVWRYVRDSTLWQSGYGYHYTGVMGDLYSREDLGLGTETFDIVVRKPGEPEAAFGPYILLHAIPEYLIVQFQPVPEDGSNGGISPGFHVTMLSEHDGRTTVTVNMEHLSRTTDRTPEEALADWRAVMAKADGLDFWRDHFIPTLKELVYSDPEPGAQAAADDEGTPTAPAFHDGRSYNDGDVHLRSRFFTFRGNDGLVAGKELNVMFTLDRPASEVWPYFRDPTLWQSGYGYNYTGVLGDLYSREDLGLGTETFDILVRKPGEPEFKGGPYILLRAIPEYLIVQFQPVPEDGANGGISPGFHVMMLNEHDGKTTVTINMEHATRTTGLSAEEAVAERRALAAQADGLDFWRDHFIPDLKRLVSSAGE